MGARLRNIVRAAREYGIEFEKPDSGSHWKAKKHGYRTYPIPAHNKENSEISDQYIRGFCRNFEIDASEFRSKL